MSLQVHPDDEAASELENAPYGKNESWYFLKAPGSGKIFDGTNPKSIDKIKNLIDEKKLSEIADTLEVKAGDYVYVEAGTLHAITSGAIVYGIEENAEYTYRVYDFDRVDAKGNKRTLHINQALRALKPELKSFVRHYDDNAITERLYTTQLLNSLASYKNKSKTLECLTIIDNQNRARLDGIDISFGMTIVLEPNEEIHLKIGETIMSRVNIDFAR